MNINLKKMADESLRRDWCAKYGAGDPELDRYEREHRLMDFLEVAEAVLEEATKLIYKRLGKCKGTALCHDEDLTEIELLKRELLGEEKK